MNEHVPDVPILIAGNGDRVLRLAAQRAHIIGLTGGGVKTRSPIRSPTASHMSATPQATASMSWS